jgi:hypothetical protein
LEIEAAATATALATRRGTAVAVVSNDVTATFVRSEIRPLEKLNAIQRPSRRCGARLGHVRRSCQKKL